MRQTSKGLALLAALALSAVLHPRTAHAQACMVTTPIGPADDLGTAIAIQSDGQIVLAGYSWSGTDDDFAVVRYNHDLTLDSSFGTGGIVTTDIGGAEDRAEAMVIQPDGKILLAGHKNSGAGNNDFALVRYNIDGSLDTTFNPGGLFGSAPNLPGMVVTPIGPGNDEIEAVVLQPNGKIVVAGFTESGTLDYVAARYNSDGSLDTAGFNAPNGFYVSTNGASDDVANAVAIQPSDGKIVVAGYVFNGSNDDFVVVRLNTDGTKDVPFGDVLINFPPNSRDRAHALLVQPADGKIVLAGEVRSGGWAMFGAARRNPDGSPDLGFGPGGVATTDFTGAHDIPFGMVLQADQKLVLAGYANWSGVGTSVDFALLRYNADGTPDNSYDGDSKVTTNFPTNDNDWIDSLALQGDGKTIAGGYSANGANDDFALARYNIDGSIDASCISTSYRSIGIAPPRTSPGDGTVTVVTGSKAVTGTGTQWRTWNRGRGDVITIDGADYTVAGVLSDTELRLTTPYAGTPGAGQSYTIDRQFDTLTEWEDCIDGPGGVACTYFPVASNDLVADNRNEVGIAYDDSTFDELLVIDPANADATHFVMLTVDPGNRHAGVAGTGVVLDPSSTGANFHAISILTPFTRIEWLEITDWGGNSSEGVHIEADSTVLEYLLIHGGPQTVDVECDGIYVGPDLDMTGTIRNTIVYNVPRVGLHLQNYQGSSTVDFDAENVTVYNAGTVGVWVVANASTTTTLNALNTLSVGNGIDYNLTGSATPSWGSSDFNISSDVTAPPSANRWTGVAAAAEFVSIAAGSEDLHLLSTATAIDKGTTLTSANDIDFESRPKGAQWDIGADEAVATGTCPTEEPPWFDTAWRFRKAIALNSTLVAGPLTNFPVLVVLANDPDIQAPATQATFNDIVFTASDGVTKLPHEIEAYDSAQGDLTAWVKVPYVSNGADTVIYIYYGNLGAADQRDPTNVWDSNYVGVWHLKETSGGAGAIQDSTSKAHHGSTNGTPNYAQAGQIANAIGFDGDPDFINVADTPDINFGPAESFTVSTWVNASVGGGSWRGIVTKSRTSGNWYGIWTDPLSNDLCHCDGDALMGGVLPLTTWKHVAITYDPAAATTKRIFVDGNETNSNAFMTGHDGPDDLVFARGDVFEWFVGLIDEVRISTSPRSQEWLKTSYNNQFDPIADPAGFCKICAQTTEVSLESFEASGFEGEVELQWRTASELDNLGFHLYRATTEEGPYRRITEQMIPGLVSSAVGARYDYRDTDLVNGTTYFYELEDIESTGKATRHGPVSATPELGLHEESPEDVLTEGEEETPKARITYGEPGANTFEIVRRTPNGVTLRLETRGFYAEPLQDGTVRISIPGLDELAGESSLPVKRSWLDAVPGLKVDLTSVRVRRIESIDGLQPAGSAVDELVASQSGTVRVRRRRLQKSFKGDGLVPEEAARLVSVGFQGDAKKALVELAPLRWDAAGGRLLLAKHLEVRVVFRGRDLTEGWNDRRFRGGRKVLARLVTRERGLYGARFEEVFGKRKGVRTRSLRLSRQGEVVPYHVEPNPNRFGPGSTLYFLGEGAAANPYGNEAVYELELEAGQTMSVSSELAAGELARFYWRELEREENRYYQPGLLQARDVWLWDLLMPAQTKSYSFQLGALAPVSETSRLMVWLQGTSDEPVPLDHHIRAYINGTFVGESSWDGKRAQALEVEIHPGVLVPGENVLALENVGDTGSDFSMVMLDRFMVRYPSPPLLDGGTLEGTWSSSGVAEVSEAYVLDTTGSMWLGKTTRFPAKAGHRYFVASELAVIHPDVERPRTTGLTSKRNGADYIVIGSREFLQAAEPLLSQRRSDGLRVAGVPTEELFSEFGYGEKTPDAIRDFLGYAYHEWREPTLRYVLLLGDGSFDYKDYLQTGVVNHVPPKLVKTSYLWTASDPYYAAVNGDDILPDVAIGRLPASDTDELRVLVQKILAYETGAASLDAPVVLVADNADSSGYFEADADELVSTVLAGRNPRRIFLSELGTSTTRGEILDAFDEGASLMSYIGHGAIHLWADELLFHTGQIPSLARQPQQPLLLTMNCLNGYFHFPYFDSLAEGLVKAEGKGAIAAFSPSGLSLNAPAARYHKAFLTEILLENHERLGDAVLAAQKAYATTGAFPELLTIFHLFGDPALKLP